jgi:hypothetical protein
MKKHAQKIERFFEKNLQSDAMDLSVIRLPTGDYMLFNRYIIRPTIGLYKVLINEIDNDNNVFSSLKVAVTWCVFHEKKRIAECKDIENLDFKLSSTLVELSQHNKILDNSKDAQVRMLYYSKLENSIERKKMLEEKLNKYINLSKNWQHSKYNKAKPVHKR